MTALPRLLYAHRGASAHAPENTLVAFEKGLADGADALELDVHLTKDGQVVVSHDPDAARTCGVPRAYRDCTLEEIRTWDAGTGFRAPDGSRPFAGRGIRVATLEEVLQAFPVLLNVDLKAKDSRLVKAVMELVAKYRAADRVRLVSFYDANLGELQRLGYPGPTTCGPREGYWLVFAPRWLSRRLPPVATALQIPTKVGRIRLDRRDVIERAHALGVRVDYWVINDPAEGQRLLDLGADGLVSDDPARLKPLFTR